MHDQYPVVCFEFLQELDNFEVPTQFCLGLQALIKPLYDAVIYPAMLNHHCQKRYKDLTMKLEVKYLFKNLSLGAHFYIYEMPEGLGMRKILVHGIRM